jgi:hypothetical protein
MALILSGDTGVPASGMPTGSVIQTVQPAPSTGNANTSSSTFVSSGFSASITPLFATSKILILVNTSIDTQASGNQVLWTIYRGSTNVLDSGSTSGNGFNGAYAASTRVQQSTFGCVLDSPATTSSTTYTIYYRSTSSANSYINSTCSAYITLMEIKQ